MRGGLLALTLALSTTACAGSVEQRQPDARSQEVERLMNEAESAFEHGDAARARALMEQAAATGQPDALNGYAVYVARGIGGEPDPKRAEKLVEQAAAAGSIGAKLNLALNGIDSDDLADQRRAVALLGDLHANPPDDKGKDAVRMFAAGGLARAYLFGIAVDKDVARGVDLLEEADASAEAEPKVLYLLGRAFESGWGGRAPDSVKSYLYFMRAAQKDHAPSQWKVGMRLLNLSGVERDEREAYRWVRMSGEAGYLNGEISTAVMLALGQGVAENDAEARTWYERAAQQNSAHALRGLGFMLLTGEGGARDPARGLAYVQLAADAGDENAVNGLDWSRSQASADERKAAETIAAQWLSEHGKPRPD
jgi:TPR repeat protein